MSLTRRISVLENRAGSFASPTERERAVDQEVLRRMTDEELDAYEATLRRDAGEDATVEDRAIVARVGALHEEVRHAFST